MFDSRLRAFALATLFAVLALGGLSGASCSTAKKPQPSTDATPRPDARPAVEEELSGIDVSDLKADSRQQFFRLLDDVPSPCGKGHSLRVSLKTDPECRRSTFAARYIKNLSTLGGEDEEVLELVKARYQQDKLAELDVAGAPYEGQPDAKVRIVEFFDYECPHCKLASPLIEDVVAAYPGEVVVYFLHFPLDGHAGSLGLAAAAHAAQKQGKFRDMHKKIFAAQGDDQSDAAIKKIAQALGLDMARFEADWKAPATEAFVRAQKAQGKRVEIGGTPAIYINGRAYSDPLDLEWIKSWIDEELAVAR
jgi:protein-disulfide isomerase